MNKYPTVNYIGNKEKIAEWIIKCFPIKKGIVLDLFCGGCSLAYELKKSGFQIITNDGLYSNYCISKALIENTGVQLDIKIDEESIKKYYNEDIYKEIEWMANKLYFEYEVKELACLISFSKSLKGSKKYLFLTLLRRAMIRKIPYSRMNIKWEEIVKFRDEELSYRKYKRRRAYHNKSFTFHILDNMLEYNMAVFSNGYKNRSYQKDAVEFIKKMRRKVDLVYLDPPYPSTMNKYKEFYGSFDMIFKKEIMYTDFTDKNNFIDNLRNIVYMLNGKTKYIAISLNNRSKPSYDEIKDNLEAYVKEINVFKMNHIYKLTGKDNKNTNYEVLLMMEV